MKRLTLLAIAVVAAPLAAQQAPAPQPFFVGNRLGLPISPAADGAFEAISSNVKVYGAIYSAESCSYDADRGVIVVPNRGVPPNVQTNNAWVSLINHDGSVHTARWIGVQNPTDRSNLTPPLVLNEPLGSDIANGMLYVADRTVARRRTSQALLSFAASTSRRASRLARCASHGLPGSTTSRSRTTAPCTPRKRAIGATIRIP